MLTRQVAQWLTNRLEVDLPVMASRPTPALWSSTSVRFTVDVLVSCVLFGFVFTYVLNLLSIHSFLPVPGWLDCLSLTTLGFGIAHLNNHHV